MRSGPGGARGLPGGSSEQVGGVGQAGARGSPQGLTAAGAAVNLRDLHHFAPHAGPGPRARGGMRLAEGRAAQAALSALNGPFRPQAVCSLSRLGLRGLP